MAAEGFSFVGLVNIHKRTASGGKGLGRLVGNCPKLTMTFDPKSVERNSSMDVSRSPLRRMTQATQASIELVTDEFSKANFAQATRSRVDEVAADPTTVFSETMPIGALAGSVLSVSRRNINTVVVTDSTVGTAKNLAKDVNYTLDPFTGDITILDLSNVNGGPFLQPFKVSYKQGAVSILSGLTLPDEDLWISLNGTNADTFRKGMLDTYRVRLDVTKTIEWLNADYQDFALVGTVLLDSTKPPSAIGGQLFQFVAPSDMP